MHCLSKNAQSNFNMPAAAAAAEKIYHPGYQAAFVLVFWAEEKTLFRGCFFWRSSGGRWIHKAPFTEQENKRLSWPGLQILYKKKRWFKPKLCVRQPSYGSRKLDPVSNEMAKALAQLQHCRSWGTSQASVPICNAFLSQPWKSFQGDLLVSRVRLARVSYDIVRSSVSYNIEST